MIVVLDETRAQRDLAAGTLRCPSCSGPRRSWGYARTRRLRLPGGATLRLRSRRARCRDCAVTHVLLPAVAPVRRAYTIDVIGEVLLSSVQGHGHRTIGARSGIPPDTVRSWIRRAGARAEWLRAQATIALAAFDPTPAPIEPPRSRLADAILALSHAMAAARRISGPTGTAWQLIAIIA